MDGNLPIGFVPSGTWKIQIWPFSVDWCYELPTHLEVAPGEVLELDVPIHRVSGSIVVFDEATGKPLARRTIHLLTPEHKINTLEKSLETDEHGQIDLLLPAGTYRLACFTEIVISHRVTEDDFTILEWTEFGPVDAEVPLSVRSR